VVRLTVDLPQELYDCLEQAARRMQRERGGRASKAEVIRKLIEAACKGGEGGGQG
jgi:Arc/MetJ-type ribon-helix-helix transcriptional regulator